ncbi:MAG: thiol-disulfide oxidoreductase DCC family protein [Ferruginibacter sp.]
MHEKIDTRPIIFFDGVCNLCNAAVQFIINRDPEEKFLFASLQGPAAQDLLPNLSKQSSSFNTIILLKQERKYTKSTAALMIARQLKGPVSLLYGFIIVPSFLRDWFYKFIASNRYTWFGKKDICMIPDKNIAKRFLQ